MTITAPGINHIKTISSGKLRKRSEPIVWPPPTRSSSYGFPLRIAHHLDSLPFTRTYSVRIAPRERVTPVHWSTFSGAEPTANSASAKRTSRPDRRTPDGDRTTGELWGPWTSTPLTVIHCISERTVSTFIHGQASVDTYLYSASGDGRE